MKDHILSGPKMEMDPILHVLRKVVMFDDGGDGLHISRFIERKYPGVFIECVPYFHQIKASFDPEDDRYEAVLEDISELLRKMIN